MTIDSWGGGGIPPYPPVQFQAYDRFLVEYIKSNIHQKLFEKNVAAIS